MNRSDWLYVGLKLSGIYLGVLGLASLAVGAVSVVATVYDHWVSEDAPYRVDSNFNVFRLLQPAIYIVAAFVLLRRTAWCLKIIDSSPLGATASETQGTIQ